MNPVGITFVDDKFLPIAEEQQRNFNAFGLDHKIIKINSNSYDINLWMELINETIKAVRTYGKIFKVDAEVRIEKEIPGCWLKANNVLFFIEPIIANPYYIALNTGQIILDESSLLFLDYQKILTESLIPPGHTGKLGFDDEDMTAPAIKLSKIQYLKEVIDYDRNDLSIARATRGSWKTPNTILTHPFIHNWNVLEHNIGARKLFRNHFRPDDITHLTDAVLLGLDKQVTSEIFWHSIGFEEHDLQSFKNGDWYVNPLRKSFWHTNYPEEKFI